MLSFEHRSTTTKLCFVFLGFLLFTTCLVNLNGGDWDGIQIALGSFFPEAAQAGHLRLYNRPWQPLTYAIIQTIYHSTASPEMAMFLPALFGSVAIGILLATMSRLSRERLSVVTLVAIILLMPEFLFGAIYMNSTVFGLPFAALAMWLACPDWTRSFPESKPAALKHLLSGLSLALAVLCRFDFVLTFPMFLLLLACGHTAHRWRNVLAFGLGSAVVMLPALGSGVAQPLALLEALARHRQAQALTGQFYRPPLEKFAQATVGVNPIVWLLAGATAMLYIAQTIRKRNWRSLSLIAPAAVLLYPVVSTTTPKYLVPFDLFLAAFLAWSLSETVSSKIVKHPTMPWLLGTAVALACFVPARFTTRPPFLHLTMNAAIPTDDGPRAFFGYAHSLRHQATLLGPPYWLECLLTDPQDRLVVAPYDGWLAGSLSQRIVMHVVRHCRDTSISPGTLSAFHAGRRLVVCDPNRVQENITKYFAAENRNPVRIPMPHGFTAQEVRVLDLLSTGTTTLTQLQQQTAMNDGDLQTALTRLRWAEVLAMPNPDRYHLKYRMNFLEANPDQNVHSHQKPPDIPLGSNAGQ